LIAGRPNQVYGDIDKIRNRLLCILFAAVIANVPIDISVCAIQAGLQNRIERNVPVQRLLDEGFEIL
jgi:hypothetical protein